MSLSGFLVSLFAVAAGVGVVAFRNPLYSAFSLVINLLSVAALYAILDAHFLAASQVVVYAGAIMVLVLFVLMLLNLKSESGRRVSFGSAVFVTLAALILLGTAVPPIVAAFSTISPGDLSDYARRSNGTVYNIGRVLYTRYVVQFELASLVLLVGIVGAVMLAKRRSGGDMSPRSSSVGGEV